ncbi:hypothetical protein SAY87_008280 [Trapa incisa]|uniref:Uncharacterized protein n=1 Tax=Trapa incisa TaxID=236973 RepID=A0AAN7QGK3_9MYRT|nr:hypothetical protein SAY87_008280 [Trapa incisa]
MHGREGEERSRQLGNPHMRAAPSRLGAVRDSDCSLRSPASSSQSFFCKDGRKISVGDCALFKLPHDSPPAIGLVYRVTVTKENNLKLGVNWLYRPTEVKLGKGILLEAAPNEVFYSFEEDEIPAASLLHPCKVAFLPKGVELPPGISYFVCRRAYNISSKHLWWLTEKSHFNEQIDHLLHKTQIEMHTSAQLNGRSPKQTSGSVATSHLKPDIDSPQNTSSVQSQSKGKKRERQDQSTDSLRSERSLKMGDGDYGRCSSESMLKSDIAKIVAKGPLVDAEGVEKLVQLMCFETNERKFDFSVRSMMTSVIVTTDKPDCLSRFVQIRGLSILDDWLQDVHKRRTSDSSNPKDNDKVAEEFLLVLLRALDKLPVNLLALQMCNIGKSVNHLRTHKNLEIQKKARSLVDTWKKRVEAEMNMNDAKMGSNQAGPGSARNRPSEVPHVNRSTGGSSEDAPKSPAVQLSACKTAPMRLSQGETASKSASQFQVSVKLASPQVLAGVNPKDGQSRFGSSSSDVPPSTSRDEKSSSSSPSNNSSLSCSGDHVKNGNSSLKVDARNSVAASNKVSLASRHRKSANGFPASVGSPRETGPSRTTSMHKNVAPDKASQSGLTSDKAADVVSEVNSHKFIVKITNGTRSPARSVAVGSSDDSATNCRPSSPIPLERPDQLGATMEERVDASQANVSLDANGESLRENDFRDMNAHEEGGDGPADLGPNEEHPNTDESTNKVPVVPINSISSPRNSMKLGKVPEATIDPMSALIESCVHYEEANAPVPVGDDVGMHLLASVATGEMLKSEPESPAASPCGAPALVEPPSEANNPEMKPLPPDNHTWHDDHSKDVGGALGLSGGDGNSSHLFSGGQPVEEDGNLNSSSTDVDVPPVVPSPWCNKVPNKLVVDCSDAEMNICSEGDGESKITMMERVLSDEPQDAKASLDSLVSLVNGVKSENTAVKLGMETQIGSVPGRESREVENGYDHCGQLEAKPGGEILSVETDAKDQSTAGRSGAVNDSEMDAANKNKQNQKHESLMILGVQTLTGLGSETNELLDRKVVSEKEVSLPVSKPQMDLPLQDIDIRDKSRGCEVPSSREGEVEQCKSSDALASATGALDGNTMLEFDLNEGLSADDCKFGESMNFNTAACPAVTAPLASPLPTTNSLTLVSVSAPIAVTAAVVKGPFVPPDDLMKAKVEIGWKGSAATSAFRPAESRKVLDMPTVVTHSHDVSLVKQNRPLLDFDLNVAEETIIEDAASQCSPPETASLYNFGGNDEKAHPEVIGSARGSGGLGLDLNNADETSTDGANHSTSEGRKIDVGLRRDFDLNDEPVVDASFPSTSGQQHVRSSMHTHQQLSRAHVNGAEMGSFSTWFHPGSSYSPVTLPTVMPDRREPSFPIVAAGCPPRMMGPSAGGIQFNPEIYRGPVLSSSPGLPFPSAPFQYSVLPYGNSFPLPSSTLPGSPAAYGDPSLGGRLGFPSVHSPLMGAAGPVTSHFSHPYTVNLADGSGNCFIENNKKWNRQGLDLNSGPGGAELEGRGETSSLGQRHLSIGSPQILSGEQARLFQASNGLLKRKEPEGGWDGYRRSSWQQ